MQIWTLLGVDGNECDNLLLMIREDKVNYKIRDTSYVSLCHRNLPTKLGEKKNLPPVDLANWHLNPNRRTIYCCYYKIEEYSGGGTVYTPVIHVKDPTPYGREGVKRDTLQFGSLDEAHTDGTWRRVE